MGCENTTEFFGKKYCAFAASKRVVWVLLFLIVLLGAALRYRSFKNVGLNNWSWDLPCFLSMASTLTEKGFYNYDRRVFMAYRAWEDFLHYPFQKDDKLLSEYGEKRIETKCYPCDQGISVIFFIAYKIFGENAPLTSIWKLQLVADLLSILCIFYICRAVFGNAEALLASFLYAVDAFMYSFMPLPFFHIQTTFYYYWMAPFALITVLFWVWVFKRKDLSDTSAARWYGTFAAYGLVVGFFTLVRSVVGFIIPFVGILYFLHGGKQNMRRKIASVLVAVIAQSAVLVPLIVYNKKEIGSYSMVTRYMWHNIFVGMGFYKNKHNLTFNDIDAVKLAESRGIVKNFDITLPGVEPLKTYEAFLKKEVLRILKSDPFSYAKNVLNNLYYGLLLAPRSEISSTPSHGTRFDFNLNRFSSTIYSFVYALLVCIALLYFFFFSKEKLYMTVLIFSIGLYFVLTVSLVNPPYSFYIYGYYPIFYILLASGIVNSIKAALCAVNKETKPESCA